MRSRMEGTSNALRSPFPWVALSAALALTAAGWFGLEKSRYDEARVRFERRSESTTATLRARVIAYEQALRSSAAHVASTADIDRAGWRRYVAHLRFDERFPGFASLGYAEVVRREGTPPQAIVAFNDPARARRAAQAGFDLAADAVRRRALDIARASGEAAITARVWLPLDRPAAAPGTAAGFLMVVPVYRELPEELPMRERADAIEGYAFGAFAIEELLRASMGDAQDILDVRIYDEAMGELQPRLADTRNASAAASDAIFQRVVHFPMPGHNWTLQFLSRPQFDRLLRAEAPWGALAGGLLASVIVFLLVTALVEAWNRTHSLSVRDPLTGLFNRRYLEETMSREVPRAVRLRQPMAVAVLDLDHFKRLNDTYGHDAGDFVLMRFAELLRNATRGSDIACRFGGEEFGLILPGVDLGTARRRADAIRAAYQDIYFEFDGQPLGHFTVSAGVAELAPGEQDWAAVLREADRALYVAKQAGRNRVLSTAEL